MVEKLKALLDLGGVAGQERQAAEFLARQMPASCQLTIDAMGSLLVHRKGNHKRIMLTTGLDIPGLVVTCGAGELAGVHVIGGLEPKEYIGKRVRLADGGKALVRGEQKENLKGDDLGLELLGRPIQIGQTASLQTELEIAEQGKWRGAYLSVRSACAVLWEVLEKTRTDYDLYVVFSAQGQLGHRGAGPAAFAIEPDLAIVVQSCEANADGIRLDGGPVLCQADKRAVFHAEAKHWLQRAAERAGLSAQLLVDEKTAGAGSAVIKAAGGIPTGCLAFGVENRDTACETVSAADLQQCALLLLKGLEQ